MTPGLMKKVLCLFSTFCINHTIKSPATKTIKSLVYSATNPTTLLRKLKIAPTILPAITGNGSIIFPASLLRASASLFNHSFGGAGPEVAEPPP